MRQILLIGFLCVAVSAHKHASPELIEADKFFGDDQESVQPVQGIDNEISSKLCIYENDQTFYNLIPLINQKEDYTVDVTQGTDYKIVFNFCQKVRNDACGSTLAGLVNPNDNTCIKMARDNPRSGVTTEYQENRKYTDEEMKNIMDEDQSYGRLDLLYDGGQDCPFNNPNGESLKLRMQMYCDLDQKSKPLVQFAGIDTVNCEAIVKVTSSSACYEWSANPLLKWLESHSYWFGWVLIVLGVFVGLFGKKMFKPAICLVGTLVFTLIASFFIFSVFFSRDTGSVAPWVVFTLCGVAGIIVGLILAFLIRLGVGVLAGWGGFCLGLILYNAFLYKIDNDGKVAFWCFTIGLGVVCGLLSLWLFWHAIIIATSIVGAYGLLRGISMYAGGFPDEMELYYLIKVGKLDSVPGSFYIYMVFFGLLSLLFIIFQYKKFGTKTDGSRYHYGQHPYHINGKGKRY